MIIINSTNINLFIYFSFILFINKMTAYKSIIVSVCLLRNVISNCWFGVRFFHYRLAREQAKCYCRREFHSLASSHPPLLWITTLPSLKTSHTRPKNPSSEKPLAKLLFIYFFIFLFFCCIFLFSFNVHCSTLRSLN